MIGIEAVFFQEIQSGKIKLKIKFNATACYLGTYLR